jgi:hypothetical protein
VRDIIEHCQSRKKQLIIGCDANAHHKLWGSTGRNPRGESLMIYLVSSNLNNQKRGNEPPIVVRNRKEVIDRTPGTNKIENLVTNWHVSDDPFLSDHRYICFQISNITKIYVTYKNPKMTKWESYKDDIKGNLEIISRKIRTMRDTDRSFDKLHRAIVVSYYQNCPAQTTRSTRRVHWRNKKLSGLRVKVRKLFNIATKTG